jgi:predicted alpha/beta-hydrolase family hydrolase
MPVETHTLQIAVSERDAVSAILRRPKGTRAALVLAHGAGAGMQHPFMEALAQGLARRDIATLRFQFPYMQRNQKRPDPPLVAQATVRAAVSEAERRLPGLPLFAGGKSFGGRMTSQAQAAAPLAGVCGLLFFGFPLHPAGTPSVKRAEHLSQVLVPMLFLQGSRDSLADLGLLKLVIARLGDRTTLEVFEDADHSFHVRKSSGSTDELVMSRLADGAAAWMLGASLPRCAP